MSPADEQLAREFNAAHAAWCAARGRAREQAWKRFAAARRRWKAAVNRMHREGTT